MSDGFLWSVFYKRRFFSMFSLDKTQTTTFQERLENSTGTKLVLKINNNRSTMLSVKWEPDFTKVSLHRMFLRAPKNVMQELACYLKREHDTLAPNIKAYIEDNLQKLDYSYQLNLKKLDTKGRVYDLQQIYDDLNREYCNGELNLYITWFGNARRSSSNRITFGLFHDPLRLIKINRLLDSEHFPPYFVAYIIYHEMLHYVCPTYVDSKGIKQIHSKAFRAREKQFSHYLAAQQWIQANQEHLFTPCDAV
jgi:hypothetical protein